jgi:hypothetical protein
VELDVGVTEGEEPLAVALLDGPKGREHDLGAVRRHLVAGTALPRTLRAQLEAAVRAALFG